MSTVTVTGGWPDTHAHQATAPLRRGGGCSRRRRHLNRSPWNRINGCTIFSFLSLSPSSQFFYFWPLFVFVLFLILTTLRRDDVTKLSPSLKCRNLNFQKAASLRMMIFPRHDAIPCFDFVLNLPIFSLSVGLEPSRGSFSPSSHIFHTWGWSPLRLMAAAKSYFFTVQDCIFVAVIICSI